MTEQAAGGVIEGRDGRYRCRACDAVVTPGSGHCLICHAALDWPNAPGKAAVAPRPAPARLVERASCPRGHGSLAYAELAGAHVHACRTCAGVFMETSSLDSAFEAGQVSGALVEFASTLDRERLEQVDGKRVAYLSCPACSASMARKNFERASGIMVDSCAKHGTWFDGGELQAASSFLRAGGLERKERFEAREAETAKREREKLKELEEKIQDRERGRRWRG